MKDSKNVQQSTNPDLFTERDKVLERALSISEAKAVYFSEEALREPAYKLYRMDGGDTRFYYTINADNSVNYFVSVTSIWRSVFGLPYGLVNWMIAQGGNRDYERDSSAAYGTLMHIEIEKVLIAKRYDLDRVYDVVDAYTDEVGYREKRQEWAGRLQRDILSFMAFMQRHKVKPLAIEVMLASNTLGVAGAVDLLCEMEYTEKVKGFHGEVYKSGKRKGEPKETTIEKVHKVTAIIDFKSGENFYDSHVAQLGFYKQLVQENFDITVDKVYNWSPKKWRSSPDFNLKDQTDSPIHRKIPHIVELYRIDHPEIKPRRPLDMEGVIELDSNLDEHFNRESLEEMIVRLTTKQGGQDDEGKA